MSTTAPGILLLLLLNVWPAKAHRLDEYLQAIRVAVTTNSVELSIDLTPGVAVLPQVIAVVDADADGWISEAERDAYAKEFVKDLRAGLDNRSLHLSLTSAEFPALHEMKGGLGVIRIKATAPTGHLTNGPHSVTLTNAHLPAISVHLVNALVPRHPTIQITGQFRDELQKGYRLNFGVAPSVR